MRLTWEVWCVEDSIEPCLGFCRNKQETKAKWHKPPNLPILCTDFMLP